MASSDESLGPRALSRLLGKPLQNVIYHVKVLRDCHVIELTGTKEVGGSVAHFYRFAIDAPWALAALGLDSADAAAPPGPDE